MRGQGRRTFIVPAILQEIQRRSLDNEPLTYYIKTIRGRVAVDRISPMSGEQETIILKGDVADPAADLSEAMIALYTEHDLKYFEQANRKSIEQGRIVPHDPEKDELDRINAITDDELRELVTAKFFTLKAKLSEFTSSIPITRALRIAKEENRPIKTIEVIEARLAELQVEDYVPSKIELER
jgi:hypothetical protein